MSKTTLVSAPRAPQVPAEVTPAALLQMAVSQGADLDRLEKLMDLQERWEANQARKAYVAAMAAFKADPPHIVKNKQVAFGNTRYTHATHDEVTVKIAEALARQDLSHAWKIDQAEGRVTVTCTITHVLGHSESVTMHSGADVSGQKNAIQAIASAVTYLQRYTLLSVTGTSTSDIQDDDGRGTTQAAEPAVPEGFETWWADMCALADNGTDALKKAWTAAMPAYRAQISRDKTLSASWERLKQIAQEVAA